MRYLTATSTLDELTGTYGPHWQPGILTEHLHLAEANPAIIVHATRSGAIYAYPADGGRAVPIVCSELVRIETEDGPITGRCGLPVHGEDFDCPRHPAGAVTEVDDSFPQWHEFA